MKSPRYFSRCMFLTIGLLAPVLLGGCSQRPDDRPETYQVTGKVTYQNKPVAGATVAFMGAGMPRAATGTTNEAGEFSLTTFAPDDGAMAGKHQISVMKPNPNATTVSDLESPEYQQAMKEVANQSRKPPEPQNGGLPVKYANRETSGLELTVTAEGPNVFEIVLQD